jgi:hypothetical protein
MAIVDDTTVGSKRQDGEEKEVETAPHPYGHSVMCRAI